MSVYLFPDFLDDASAYDQAERFWARLWHEVLVAAGAESAWVTPWLNTTCADGTRMRDGDPIFSALRADKARAVRVVQSPPRHGGPDWHVNVRTFDPDYDAIPLLEVFCALSPETAVQAREALTAWVATGALSPPRPPSSPPRPSRSPADNPGSSAR